MGTVAILAQAPDALRGIPGLGEMARLSLLALSLNLGTAASQGEKALCIANIVKAKGQMTVAYAEISKMLIDCKELNTASCADHVQQMVSAIGGVQVTLAEVGEECAAEAQACMSAVTTVTENMKGVGRESEMISKDCEPHSFSLVCL